MTLTKLSAFAARILALFAFIGSSPAICAGKDPYYVHSFYCSTDIVTSFISNASYSCHIDQDTGQVVRDSCILMTILSRNYETISNDPANPFAELFVPGHKWSSALQMYRLEVGNIDFKMLKAHREPEGDYVGEARVNEVYSLARGKRRVIDLTCRAMTYKVQPGSGGGHGRGRP